MFFLDIAEAFSHSSFHPMCVVLVRHRVGYTTVGWIKLPWRAVWPWGPLGLFHEGSVSRGCAQGGVMSPLLWCLVVDQVTRLNWGGVNTQGNADDTVF